MSSLSSRRQISEDTLARIPAILHEVRDGSPDSTFISEQLPPLSRDKCPNFPPTKIKVINLDSFTAARDIIRRAADNGIKARGKTAVLNLASDVEPAGGWAKTLCRTQASVDVQMSLLYWYWYSSVLRSLAGGSPMLLVYPLPNPERPMVSMAECWS